jgi:hypothetical protein
LGAALTGICLSLVAFAYGPTKTPNQALRLTGGAHRLFVTSSPPRPAAGSGVVRPPFHSEEKQHDEVPQCLADLGALTATAFGSDRDPPFPPNCPSCKSSEAPIVYAISKVDQQVYRLALTDDGDPVINHFDLLAPGKVTEVKTAITSPVSVCFLSFRLRTADHMRSSSTPPDVQSAASTH